MQCVSICEYFSDYISLWGNSRKAVRGMMQYKMKRTKIMKNKTFTLQFDYFNNN